jgi:hypothetical protein
MNYKIVKGFLMYGLPVVGAGSLIGGTVSGIMQATNPDNKKLSFADEISLSGGPIEINAVTNDKTVALEEIKISSHPTSASHEIT